ncbi:YaaC family protein [Neobacillus sp. SM06]|uniref:YaaC family protein n=1 Tax=Neobacillus sp. SM06 TaxID=3422492 RepID=UPI003D2DA144
MLHYTGWRSFLRFFSAEDAQAFLKKKYELCHIESAHEKSFDNCYTFLYYLEHGQIYYEQAEKAPLILKPILIFYGLVHLIKASILTIDPNYPESTTVLAHGVSTRKRKKQNYHFFQDEVKLQKYGLFPYMSKTMFHMEQLEGDKITMEVLFQLVPELSSLFFQLDGKRTFAELLPQNGQFLIPEKVLDHYHMTASRFNEFLLSRFADSVSLSADTLSCTLNDSFLNKITPFKYNIEDQTVVLPLIKNTFFHYPELLVHYLLLYNLSMIARYETEWWGDLTKSMPTKDYPFIEAFLSITEQKSPFLIYQFLMEK